MSSLGFGKGDYAGYYFTLLEYEIMTEYQQKAKTNGEEFMQALREMFCK